MPLWAGLIAALFAVLSRTREVFGPAFAISAVALVSHSLTDLITAYGTALFYPLTTERYSIATTFVIDPLFSLIVLTSLVLAVRLRRRTIAVAGLVLLTAYVGGQWQLRADALAVAGGSAQAAALPQPFSPFNWKGIVADGETYREAHFNLVGHRPWLPEAVPFGPVAHAYPPSQLAQWRQRERWGSAPEDRALALALWNDARFEPFRRFARFPALSSINRTGASTCVWFTDLRYDLPALPDTFRFGFCREEAGAPWELYRLRYFSAASRQRLPEH
jgi:inner membrane protein